jgi:RNA polymerase sigma-70 factor (ECF subfamily)
VSGAAENVIPQLARGHAAGGADAGTSRFEGLYLAQYPRIVSVLHRVTGDLGQSEELANEVFAGLYRDRGSLLRSSDGDLGGWLFRAAVNLGIDAVRKTTRRRKYEKLAFPPGDEIDSHADPLADALARERQRRVRIALATLKPVQAQILALRASGFSYLELAASLGIGVGSVGTQLARAEAAFEKKFRKLFPLEET